METKLDNNNNHVNNNNSNNNNNNNHHVNNNSNFSIGSSFPHIRLKLPPKSSSSSEKNKEDSSLLSLKEFEVSDPLHHQHHHQIGVNVSDKDKDSIQSTSSPIQDSWGEYDEGNTSENYGLSSMFANRSLGESDIRPQKLSFHNSFSPTNNTNTNRNSNHHLSTFVSEFSLDSKATEDIKMKSNVSIPLPKNQSSTQSFSGLDRAYSLTSMDDFSYGNGLHGLEMVTPFTTDEETYHGTSTHTSSSLPLNYLDDKRRSSKPTLHQSNNSLLNIQKSPSSPSSNSSSSLTSGGTTNSTSSAITTTNSNSSKESHLSSTKTENTTNRARSIASSNATVSMTRGIGKMALSFDVHNNKKQGGGSWNPKSHREEDNETMDDHLHTEIAKKENNNWTTNVAEGTKASSFPNNINNNNTKVHFSIESTSGGYEKRNHDWDQNLNLDFHGPYHVPNIDDNIDLSLIDRDVNRADDERHSLDIMNMGERSNRNKQLNSTQFSILTRMEHNTNSDIPLSSHHHHHAYREENINAPGTLSLSNDSGDNNLIKNIENRDKNVTDTFSKKNENGNERKDKKKQITGNRMLATPSNSKGSSKNRPSYVTSCNTDFETSNALTCNTTSPQYQQMNDTFKFQLQNQFNLTTGAIDNTFNLPLNPNFGIPQLSMNFPMSSSQHSIPSASDFSGVNSSTSNNTYSGGPITNSGLGHLPINPQGGPIFDNLMSGSSLSSPLVSNMVGNPFSMAFFNQASNPQSYSIPGSPNMDYHTMSRFNNVNKVNFISPEMNNHTSLFSQKVKNKSKGQKSPGNNGVAHIKNKWGTEEDLALTKLVNDFGTKNWVVIATRLGTNRTGKQCRERWVNQLDPAICKEVWSPEEERILEQAHEKFGNKWAKIAKLLPGRSDNACKNKINGAIKRHQKQKVTDVTKKNISLSSPKKNKGASKKTSSNGKKSSLDNTKMGYPLDSSFLVDNRVANLSQSFSNSFRTSNSSLDNSRTTCESSNDNSVSASLSTSCSSPSSGNRQTFFNKSGKRSQEEAALRTSADLASNPSLGDLAALEVKQEGTGNVKNKEGNIPRNVSVHVLEEDDLIKKRRVSVEEKEFKRFFPSTSNNSSTVNASHSNISGSSNTNDSISYQRQSHHSDEIDFDLDLTNPHEGNITSLLHFSND